MAWTREKSGHYLSGPNIPCIFYQLLNMVFIKGPSLKTQTSLPLSASKSQYDKLGAAVIIAPVSDMVNDFNH